MLFLLSQPVIPQIKTIFMKIVSQIISEHKLYQLHAMKKKYQLKLSVISHSIEIHVTGNLLFLLICQTEI